MMVRFPSGIHDLAAPFTSASVMPGSMAVARRCTCSGFAMPDCFRTCDTSWFAYDLDSVLPASVTARSSPRTRLVFCRSNSVGVKPKRLARSISASVATSASVNLPSLTMAATVKASRFGSREPLPAKAKAKGVLSRCDNSPRRCPTRPVYIPATSDSRHAATVPRLRAGRSQLISAMLCGSSLSDASDMRVSAWSGTSYQGRGRGLAGLDSPEKRALMARSIAAASKSPTAMTAIRLGRYQSR